MYVQARFVSAEKNVKELNLSVDLMKKESKKLLERELLAEKDMKYGQTDLMYPPSLPTMVSIACIFITCLCVSLILPSNSCRDVGSQIQSLSKSVHKVESQAAGLSS